ncbi:MAG: pantoate--beta-alanine ligase [Pseudomonadota bacterium]
MNIYTTAHELRQAIAEQRSHLVSIGLVPTMGNLHDGHLSLVKAAKHAGHWTIATIFINPTQFAAHEDLDNYPRTEEEDARLLCSVNCDALFLPSVDEMYPSGLNNITTVSTPQITDRLCGASRPGHFDGVTTVVTKLFNLVGPDSAFFGEKDFQQLATIRKMCMDLNVPIEIVGVPITRADDNLALSSRNGYLSSGERILAPKIYSALSQCKTALLSKNSSHRALEAQYTEYLNNQGFQVDYFEICNTATLRPSTRDDTSLVILAAAVLGTTRLIDNVTLTLN